MVAKFGWSKEEATSWDMWIGSLPVLGLFIGRFIGTPIVNKSRYLCLLLGAVIIVIGSLIIQILDIYAFLFGRLIFALGSSFIGAAAPRYIEECSPPHEFSKIFTVFGLGIAMNRPLLMITALMVPVN
jgi:MFS family permease